jgi:hypothetical protein
MKDSGPDKAAARPRTVAEHRRSLADAGDVEALWEVLTGTAWCMLDVEEMFKLLVRALEVAGRKGPAAHAQQLFRLMLSFSAGLVLRSEYYISRILDGHDRSTRGRAAIFLPRDLTEEHLAQVLTLQTHLADLMESQARTARLWGLARRRPEAAPSDRRARRRDGQEVTAPTRQGAEGGAYETVE